MSRHRRKPGKTNGLKRQKIALKLALRFTNGNTMQYYTIVLTFIRPSHETASGDGSLEIRAPS